VISAITLLGDLDRTPEFFKTTASCHFHRCGFIHFLRFSSLSSFFYGPALKIDSFTDEPRQIASKG
jgi:hypothetical protein